MLNPVLIILIIVGILFFIVLIKKMIKIMVILGIIFIILLVMYPKECGYSFEDKSKECECTGFFRQEGMVGLCYGFCSKQCNCMELNQTNGNFTEVECNLEYIL